MIQTTLNDKLIAKIVESAETSGKKDKVEKYIGEVAERCCKLCAKGENLRVLNEYKLMIENLRKEFNL